MQSRGDLYHSSITILRQLVRYDTTSRRNGVSNSNLELMDYVRTILNDSNIKSELVSNPGDEGRGANLIVRIGPDAPGGILLSGHTDVVTVDRQPTWSSDPFVLTEKEGWFYGRGTADMKGFVACVLAMIPVWAKANLVKPIYLVFSYDEEVGCVGIASAVKLLKERGIMPDLCIVGEPTEFMVAEAHRSRALVRLACEAGGGHASKINDPAITSAFDLGTLAYANMIRDRHTIGQKLGNNFFGAASMALTSPAVLGETNVILSDYAPYIDIRARRGITINDVHDALWPYAESALEEYGGMDKTGKRNIRLDVEMVNPGFQCHDEAAIQLAMQFAATKKRGKVDFVSEAARYEEQGVGMGRIVVCGPGSIDVAHQPNECVHPRQLMKCIQMLTRAGLHVTEPAFH